MTSSCPECGAARFGMPWCGQCGHIEAAPAGYRHDADGKPVWDGIEVIPVRDLRRPTRWRSTVTTLGPIWKLAITYFFVLHPLYRLILNVIDGNEDYHPFWLVLKAAYWSAAVFGMTRLWRHGYLPPQQLPVQRVPAEGGMLTGCPSTSDPAGGSRTTS